MANPTYNLPTADFVTTTLNGAITAVVTSFTVGAGLALAASNGVLEIDYDGLLGTAESIPYTSYNSGTGAVTGATRGGGGTTAATHVNGAPVQAAFSVLIAQDMQNGTGFKPNVIPSSALQYNLVRQRQGASASTDWSSPGTTNFDITTLLPFVQVGQITTSAGGDTTVTFPVTYVNTPIVVATYSTEGGSVAAISVQLFSKSQSAFSINTWNAASSRVAASVSWFAVGI